jgi:hypothetical protein
MAAASRLILIEGMIGSGKTTTAERLGDWLSGRGEDVRAFDEGAADHPIRTRRVDELLGEPAPGDPDAYSASQWRRLAERCLRDGRMVILQRAMVDYVRGRVSSGESLGGLAADVRKLAAEGFALLEQGLAGYDVRA